MDQKPANDWVLADVRRYVRNKVRENIGLDYKASGALARDERKRADISKDVSSFANSEGGILIYGVTESKEHYPVRMDGGSDPAKINDLWLEQVIGGSIRPRVQGVRIKQIDLARASKGRSIFVVTVPQSIVDAPHQAIDKRYYKRHNFESVAMEDFEVKDTMRRSRAPELSVVMGLEPSVLEPLQPLGENPELLGPVTLRIVTDNASEAPAEYSLVTIHTDKRITMIGDPGGKVLDDDWVTNGEQKFRVSTRLVKSAIPGKFPIFKGVNFLLFERPFVVALPTTENDGPFVLSWSAAAPGMSVRKGVYTLSLVDGKVSLKERAD